ncbi:MAG TPA: hypothetical protein VHW01_07040 [Polyangiaceae bacterium]|nr:hypothetical protein [Polyangiaceae bacterium]
MRLVLALFLTAILVACATHSGSSPNVPKKAIEKAADTKIPDAGPD